MQMNKTTTVVIAAGAVLATATRADTLNVPGDYPTIVAAVGAALEGDTITVNPGTWNETVAFNGHNISLIAVAGPDLTTIRAPVPSEPHTLKVLLGETVTLEGFTVTGSQRGLFVAGGHVEVANCRFEQNVTGVRLESGTTGTFDHCTFDNNSNDGVSGGTGSQPLSFDFCSFSNNDAVGMDFFTAHWLQVSNCTVIGNGSKGLVAWMTTQPVVSFIRNTLIAENGAHGVQILFAGNPTLSNLTVVSNGTDGLNLSDCATIRNCILWNNSGVQLNADPLDIDAAYNLIEGGFPGAAFGFVGDPLFVGGGDYRLQAGSPCIDSGLNSAAVGLVVDVYGDPRFVNAARPDCPQPGADCGKAPIIDMGAAEHQPGPCPDLDGDGFVGINDFLDLLAAWGPNPGHPADYDGDGFVGISDFLLLLASWGECP